MKGLVYKDYLVYQRASNKITKLLTIAFYISLLLIFKNIYMLALIVTLSIPVGCSSIPTTLRDQDEKVNSNQFTLSLPYQKKDIVVARFIFLFLYILKEMLISFIITLFAYYAFHLLPFNAHMLLWACGFVLAVIFGSLNLFGSYFLNLNGVVIMYLVSLIFMFIIYLIPLIFGISFLDLFTKSIYSFIILLVLLLCIYGSIWGSIKLFERSYS